MSCTHERHGKRFLKELDEHYSTCQYRGRERGREQGRRGAEGVRKDSLKEGRQDQERGLVWRERSKSHAVLQPPPQMGEGLLPPSSSTESAPPEEPVHCLGSEGHSGMGLTHLPSLGLRGTWG